MKNIIKFFIPNKLMKLLDNFLQTRLRLKPIYKRKCNICNFDEWINKFRHPLMLDTQAL